MKPVTRPSSPAPGNQNVETSCKYSADFENKSSGAGFPVLACHRRIFGHRKMHIYNLKDTKKIKCVKLWQIGGGSNGETLNLNKCHSKHCKWLPFRAERRCTTKRAYGHVICSNLTELYIWANATSAKFLGDFNLPQLQVCVESWVQYCNYGSGCFQK